MIPRSRLAFLIACAALAVFGGRQPARAGLSKGDIRLQLKWLNQAQFAGYYVAHDKGFYAAEGLNIVIQPGGPDIASEDVVNRGDAEFGIDWLSALLVARERGEPLQNIAQIFQASGMRLVAFKSSGINTISQFQGKRVGVWPSGNEYQFYALMSKYHLSPPSQFMTVLDQPFDMTGFLHHDLDVAHAMTYNELDTVIKAAGKKQIRVFDYNSLGVSILEDGIFARQDWLEQHPDTAVKFLHASIRGWDWAVKHPAAAGKISFQHADPQIAGGLPHQVYMAREVAKLIRYGQAVTHGVGYMDPQLYDRTANTLVQEGVLTKQPSGAFTQTYWQQAMQSGR